MHTWRILKYNTFKIQFKIIFSFLKISISKKILIDILFSVSTTHADNYYLLLNAYKRKYVVAYSCIFDVPQWLVFPYSLCLIFIISQKTHFTWSKKSHTIHMADFTFYKYLLIELNFIRYISRIYLKAMWIKWHVKLYNCYLHWIMIE